MSYQTSNCRDVEIYMLFCVHWLHHLRGLSCSYPDLAVTLRRFDSLIFPTMYAAINIPRSFRQFLGPSVRRKFSFMPSQAVEGMVTFNIISKLPLLVSLQEFFSTWFPLTLEIETQKHSG